MKVTVIGFWGGFPGVNEATSGYLFQHEGFNLLVDCGSGVMSKLQQFIEVEQLDAVILSHYHHDHIADIGPLQYGRLIKRNMGVEMGILSIYGHALDEAKFASLSAAPDTEGKAYDPNHDLVVGPFTISFMKTDHPVACYAMRITDGKQTVVYTADSSYKPEFVPFAKEADLLISECNFYAGQNAQKAGHMNSEEAASIARDADVNELVLTHLPHFGNHANLVNEVERVFSGKISLAETGLVWE